MANRENFNPQVGDRVMFRQWEDMEAEFGLDYYGNIECMFVFIGNMRELCGKEFKITRIDHDGDISGHDTTYAISVDMLEPVEEETEEDYDADMLECPDSTSQGVQQDNGQELNEFLSMFCRT